MIINLLKDHGCAWNILVHAETTGTASLPIIKWLH